MKDYRDSRLNFTDQAWERLYEVVDASGFKEREAESILESMLKQRPLPFCDYLKRHLYEAAELNGPWEDIPPEEYAGILRGAFRETKTPTSFEPSSVRPGKAFSLWLEQKEVSRSTVLLLGFGLALNLEEVNAFLTKGIRQEGLNRSDPKELICCWCYDHGYPFACFEDYRSYYEKEAWDSFEAAEFPLMESLKKLRENPVDPAGPRECFRILYDKTRIQMMSERKDPKSGGLFLQSELSPADMENALYEGIPLDSHGNLLSLKNSALQGIFPGKLLTRQRIHSLLKGSVQVSRYDIIHLCFLNWGVRSFSNPQIRFAAFMDETNRLLLEAGFSELYATAPYELAFMMCLLCEKPMKVFTELWERAYRQVFLGG